MYHIRNNNTCGSVQLLKSSLGDLMEMISIQPTAARVFLCICNYADIDNELIADMKTIKRITGLKSVEVYSALHFLQDNEFIEIDKVCVKNKEETKYRSRNFDLYMHAKNLIWEHVDDGFVYNARKERAFMRIIVNTGVVACSNNSKINVLLLYGHNRLYDERNCQEDINE